MNLGPTEFYTPVYDRVPDVTLFFKKQRKCPTCGEPLYRKRRKTLFPGKNKPYVEIKVSQPYCENCDYGVGICGLWYE